MYICWVDTKEDIEETKTLYLASRNYDISGVCWRRLVGFGSGSKKPVEFLSRSKKNTDESSKKKKRLDVQFTGKKLI